MGLRDRAKRFMIFITIAAVLAGTDIYLVSDHTISFSNWPCRGLLLASLISGWIACWNLYKAFRVVARSLRA